MSQNRKGAFLGVACFVTAVITVFAATILAAQAATRPDCVVPDVVNKSLAQAEAALRADHCALGSVTGARGTNTIVGSESPGARSRRTYHSKVSLVLELKPAKTTTAVAIVYECDQGNSACFHVLTGGLFTGPTTQVVGQTLDYAVTDVTTGETLARFSGASNIDASCTIAESEADGTITLAGTAEASYPACSLKTISFADHDDVVVSSSFAGNRLYAASSSEPTGTF